MLAQAKKTSLEDFVEGVSPTSLEDGTAIVDEDYEKTVISNFPVSAHSSGPLGCGCEDMVSLAPISRSQRKAWGLISIAYLGMSFPTPLRLLKTQGIPIRLLVHRFGLSPMGGPDIEVNLCRPFGGHRDSRVEVSLKILEPGLCSRVFRGILFRGKSPEYF